MEPNQLKTNWLPAAELILFLERGDLIEISRQSYTHWVVYIGIFDDIHCVAHISTDNHGSTNKKEIGAKLLSRSVASVRSDPFLIVAGVDLSRVNNSLDTHRRPFPPTIVVERALQKLGTGNYNLMHNNCEHFAKWCRYSLRESDQSLFGQAGAFGLTSLIATASLPYSLAATAVSFTILKVGQAVRRNYLMRSII
uniref:LRAT domain-containing protein n=1 Tax=Meloidogyne floridensis TaxID=298350 RepID=A0A915NTL4_9BILA